MFKFHLARTWAVMDNLNASGKSQIVTCQFSKISFCPVAPDIYPWRAGPANLIIIIDVVKLACNATLFFWRGGMLHPHYATNVHVCLLVVNLN